MTQQQWEAVEKSLSGLTTSDKLELVERLVHELRSSTAIDREPSVPHGQPATESDFKQHLLKTGLMSSLPIPTGTTAEPEFHPVMIEGEPLSETIIRERR